MDALAKQEGVSAPADEKGMEKGSGPFRLVGAKAIAATVGAGLVTLFVALAQIWYEQNDQSYARQGQQGFEFQSTLLATTGKLERQLFTAVSKSDAPEAALPRIDEFEAAYQQWVESDLLQRNLGSQLFGREVGRLIFDLSEQNLDIDRCGVLRPVSETGPITDCRSRLRGEYEALTDVVRSAREGRNVRAGLTIPSFRTSLRLARETVWIYRLCLNPEARTAPDWALRCSDINTLRMVIIRRAELVRIARERLATAIMVRSTFNS